MPVLAAVDHAGWDAEAQPGKQVLPPFAGEGGGHTSTSCQRVAGLWWAMVGW